jgi:uncharacterized membrane protein HdeD (DUF308 family)
MKENTEAAVGCSGIVLIFVGTFWFVATVPAITGFVQSIPPAVFVLIAGVLLLSIALSNSRSK